MNENNYEERKDIQEKLKNLGAEIDTLAQSTMAKEIIDVINKKMLKTGEGLASYFNWGEYGGLENQLEYFSNLLIKATKSIN